MNLSPLFLLVLVLNCAIFAEIGFLAAMKLSTYEAMTQVNTYILLPMSFLCGTFFKTAALPEGIRFTREAPPVAAEEEKPAKKASKKKKTVKETAEEIDQ